MISDTTATPSSVWPEGDAQPCSVRSKLVDLMPPAQQPTRERHTLRYGPTRVTDSDGLDARPLEYAKHGAHACDAADVPLCTHVFRAGCVYRTKADVVCTVLDCLARVLGRRTGHADDRAWGEELARDGQGHVALPDVNARGAGRERDVYAIVDDDGYLVF
jgi:hypothetical protein